jgi:Tfp pilus assembly protein PilX
MAMTSTGRDTALETAALETAALSLADRLARARARREQRGAAVFLVVMVLTILAGIGVFSMRSAGLVDLATGYSRQSVQATFVAEYAARAAATYLEANSGLVSSTDTVEGCAPALQAIDPNAPCTVFKTRLLAESLAVTAPTTFEDGVNGQLNLPSSPTSIDAEFVTEMTEPSIASITASPGFPSGLFRQVTFTSIARVFPTDGSDTGVCSNAARSAVSQQTVRAHVIVPL